MGEAVELSTLTDRPGVAIAGSADTKAEAEALLEQLEIMLANDVEERFLGWARWAHVKEVVPMDDGRWAARASVRLGRPPRLDCTYVVVNLRPRSDEGGDLALRSSQNVDDLLPGLPSLR